MASGPLDELVALHEELGIFAIVEQLEVQRKRAGVPDALLLRTLATLPFVEQASSSGASEVLFREPAVLLQLGWAPVQIRAGSNGRHRHPEGRQEESLPCHADTDAVMHCDGLESQPGCKRKQPGCSRSTSGSWYEARSTPWMAVDWETSYAWWPWCVCQPRRPIIAAWRVLSGTASEKGKEAQVTRALIEQVLAVAGPNAISLLLADALYADGPSACLAQVRQRD